MSSKALLTGLILLTASPAPAYDLSKDWTRDFSKEQDKTVGSAVRDEAAPGAPRRQPRPSDLPIRSADPSDQLLNKLRASEPKLCRDC